MPTLDSEGRVVGMVLREVKETMNYTPCYLVLTLSSHMLRMYPPEAQGEQDLSKFPNEGEVKCQYITKVGIPSTRPKVLNSFQIVTTSDLYYISVDIPEEREEWMDAIKKSSMRQGSFKGLRVSQGDRSKHGGYQTKVVAGVIHRTPIQADEGDSAQEVSATGSDTKSASAPIKAQGCPRVLKAGHATKCGAVMKSWRRRFFVLNENFLGYYKTIEEVEPIRTVPVREMSRVGPSKDYTAKENLLEVHTPNRTFYMQADTAEDMQSWIQAFKCAIGSYLPGHITAADAGSMTSSGSYSEADVPKDSAHQSPLPPRRTVQSSSDPAHGDAHTEGTPQSEGTPQQVQQQDQETATSQDLQNDSRKATSL